MPSNTYTIDDAQKIAGGILSWAINNSIYLPNNYIEDDITQGDPSLCPFSSTQAHFFKTRKIVEIKVSREGNQFLIKIYARLLPAQSKVKALKHIFDQHYQNSNLSLDITVYSTFKVDQKIEPTNEPIYYSTNNKISCGSSVGIGNQRNAGTLTALGRMEDGTLIGFSCNHVTGGCNTTRPGTPIVVPGIQDISPEHPESTLIGKHDFCGPMTQGLPSKYLNIADNCDVAIFQIEDENLVSSWQGNHEDGYDTPTDFIKPKVNMKVKKYGRTSGLTTGKITQLHNEPQTLEYSIVSFYGASISQAFKGRVYYENTIEVRSSTSSPFSYGGDSGSLVVTDYLDKPSEVIGILIGGSDKSSLILPLQKITKKLKIDLVSGL